MLREPLDGQVVAEQEEVEEEQQVEEVENEEAVGRSHTGTAGCRRVMSPGMIKSFECTS